MIFLIGSTGTLGKAIKNAAHQGSISFLAPTHQEFDITDANQCTRVLEKISEQDVVIHCAALTNWEWCHEHPVECFRVNALGTLNIARAIKEKDALLIYISTDGVFSGTPRGKGFTEEDIPQNPSSIYGISKLAGEHLAKEVGCKLLIVRIGWLFGDDPTHDKKFVGSILRQARLRKEIKAVRDKIGTVAYAPQVAKKLCEYSLSQKTGIRHLANLGAVSRYDLAQEILMIWGLTNPLKQVTSIEFPSSVKRPDISALKTIYEDATLPSWQEALREYHKNFSA